MKNGRFITQKDLTAYIPERLPEKNNRSYTLKEAGGILNVKKTFALGTEAEKVVLRATALGVFDLFINGSRVGSVFDGRTVYDEMKPGWTDYRYRVFEYEYDITSLCSESNTLVCEITSGWWNGRISSGVYGFKPNAFAGEIEIIYANGKTELISSDDSWEVMVGGPIRRADIWDGQYEDKTLPHPAKSPEAYVWEKAVPFNGFEGETVPFEGEQVRVRHGLDRHPLTATVYNGTVDNGSDYGAIKAVSRTAGSGCEETTLKAGEHLIIDFGQNMVGRPRLVISAEEGTRTEVLFAEMLNDSGDASRGNDGPMGSLYIKNYRSALARYVCVSSGEENEICRPCHVFYGFRYIEIFADRDIKLSSVTGEVIGSDLTETGSFYCDDPEVNQLYSNTLWGMRSNYLSVPTDCPQRDERLGWTGDTQIFCGAASYMADIKAFMRKWLADARHAQITLDGAFPCVIPSCGWGNCADAAWGDAGIIVPYRLWLTYADKSIIAEHYDAMERYMSHVDRTYGPDGPKPTFGDWLNYEETDGKYISVCYYAYDAYIMSKFSKLLGKTEREEYYNSLRSRIIAHWTDNYVKDGSLTVNTQTAHLLPLAFDMAEGDLKSALVEKLRQLITDNDYTLSTGFVGTGILCQTLCKVGLHDLCYSLLLQTKDPSWLYSVRQGATTIWERWNSYTIEKGFGDVGMNSFNHYAYGAVVEWLYSGMCGIMADENAPGYNSFILAPNPDMRTVLPKGQNRIRTAHASYESPAGRIESGWKNENGSFVYDFLVPEGAIAYVSIVSENDVLCFSGLEMTKEDLKAVRNGDRLEFTLKGGRYSVRVKN